MAILKIARMGHPVLKRVADPVPDPTAPEIHNLINDMLDTLADIGGAGLAAPQVHVPLRVVIFHVPGARIATEEGTDPAATAGVPLTALINPEITPLSDQMAEGLEACLSVPGLGGRVPRHTRIRYRALAPDGSVIDREATGFHARVVQHECDHLDGILYPMRMRDLSSLGFVEELRRFQGQEAAD
ncbi:peptide deformylase [Dongia mobilis]|uniref:Peptide deformylase n=1 Tax=Dongia mobilis TaxID=578943 RepID=A0A4V3DEW6_9PROT|nr:peptide deformylase [Dongia mobilis]TDQ83460.1 peptide deformylase [Dongia mobilis]